VIYGGTREAIDDVRFIANESSGATGVSLCKEAFIQGGEVLVWRSSHSLKHQLPLTDHVFTSHADLMNESKHIDADIVLVPAAISDFGVKPKEGKLSSSQPVDLTLTPHGKVLDAISSKIVAFKAVSKVSDIEMVERATKLLSEKVLLVVANDVSNAGRSHGRYAFVTRDHVHWYEGSKDGMSRELLRRAYKCLEE